LLGGSRSTGSVVARGVPLGPAGGHRRGRSARNSRRPCCPSAELSGAPATPGTVDSPAPSYLVIELCSRLRVRRVCVGRCHGPRVPISPRVSTPATCISVQDTRGARCRGGGNGRARTRPARSRRRPGLHRRRPRPLWRERLTSWAANLSASRRAPESGGHSSYRTKATGQMRPLALLARLVHAEPPRILRTDHVGWISVPGLDAKTARHRLPHDTRSSALKRPDISALRRSFTSPMTRPRRGTGLPINGADPGSAVAMIAFRVPI
jgi:hypothetical protein